jgi:MATE family, multidrug efflux pump
MAVGLTTIEPLFRALGATDAMMPYIEQYMTIWYPGMIFYIIPIVGNNIIRATGDTFTPSVVMIVGVVINAVLDPILIFGWGPIPPLGVAGAAIATVIARAITLVVALWVLYHREHLLGSPWPGYRALISSWKTILRIGLPVAISNAIIPVAYGLITRIVAGFGPEIVAGFGVAHRIESFGLALIYALSTGISPFVGQNFGAGRIDRIQEALRFAKRFSLGWGALLLATFLLLGRTLPTYFDSNPRVVQSASLYLWIVSASMGLRGVHLITWTALNVLHRPYDAMFLESLLAFGLWIPLAYFGAHLAQIGGLYCGLSLANILAGFTAYLWIDRVTAKQQRQTNTLNDPPPEHQASTH